MRHHGSTAALIKIYVNNLIKLQLRTRQGNVESNYPTLLMVPDIRHDFTIPLQLLLFFFSWDPYVFNQLSSMGFDLELCNSMKERIISSLSGLIIAYGESPRFQVIVHLRITTTLRLGSAQLIDNLMMNLLATDGATIVNDDGSIGTLETIATNGAIIVNDDGGLRTEETMRTRTEMGVSKAVIDGLKKVTVFNGEGDDEKCTTCVVCLEEFGKRTELISMPCYYLFHHHCIVPWLESHNSCPTCRSIVSD
ncbi:E3 ubiquitin-protein ligase RNF181 [Camellia lanceoleosa]|uniref:E3 ubiquitin-protein ligase RNF181 n=1 Tax=Camellia lanceoleosa TaxID=1840588 RepID=A0ACC0GCB0_9ERIC|nr:E3 ubiquitin-protein ligase RNF181 [Camellia lanceoleosa]